VFNFPFQILLDHQKRLEEKLQVEFSDCRRKLEKESSILEQHKDEVARHVKELQSQIEEGTQIEKIVIYKNYIRKTSDLIDQKRKYVSALQGEMEKAEKALIQGSTKRRVLEKLREKAWVGFSEKMEKAMRKFLDDVSLRRHIAASTRSDGNVSRDLVAACIKSQKNFPD